MTEVATDDRGRIVIPRSVRSRLGDRYRLIELDDGIKLLPIPDDPVEALRNAGSDELRSASMREIRQAVRKEASEQANERVR